MPLHINALEVLKIISVITECHGKLIAPLYVIVYVIEKNVSNVLLPSCKIVGNPEINKQGDVLLQSSTSLFESKPYCRQYFLVKHT